MQSLRINLPVQENVFGWNSDDARTCARNMMNSSPGKLTDMKKIKKKIKNCIFFYYFNVLKIYTYLMHVFKQPV